MIDFKKYTTDAGTVVIRIGGKLDHDSNEYFFQCVRDEIDAGNTQIVINCADLGYVSSLGLGVLVRARSRAAKAGGNIFLSGIESQVLEIFELVNFNKLFHIYSTEENAIAAIEGQLR